MSSRSLRPRGRKIGAAALSATLGLAGLGMAASPVGATEATTSERLAGIDRYTTAIDVSQEVFTTSDDVVLARGDVYADALAGNGVAGAVDAPILLTQSNSLDSRTAAEIERLGAGTVYIMGGTEAISQAVEDALAVDHTVVRIEGVTRIETAVDAAEFIAGTTGGIGETDTDQTTAILVNGYNFPDAVSASPAAYNLEIPVMLTTSNDLSDATAAALQSAGIERVLIVGGTDAVSAAVEAEVDAMGITTDRYAGINRYLTATDFATDFLMAELGWDGPEHDLATGEKFPDALTGGPHAGTIEAPILLTMTETLSDATEAFLTTNCEAFDEQFVLGGTAAVTDATEAAAQAAAQCEDAIGPNEVFSDAAPELVQVTELEEDVLAFEFDETITGQALRFTDTGGGREYYGFRLYDPQGNVSYPFEARIEGDSVIARFSGNATETASLATVRYNAVEDATGIPNIEGEYALLPQAVTVDTDPFSPQLTSVGNYRTADVIIGGTAELLIDYTFNSATATAELGLEANDFYLVGDFGAEYQADAIQNTTVTSPATTTSDGASVVTVAFSLNPQDVPESQLARGYVVAGTADTDNQEASGQDEDDDFLFLEADTDGEGFVLAEPYESGTDITDTPDLQSVTRVDATTYRFQFDEAVSDTELIPTGFFVFDADGDMTEATGVARSALAADEASVVIATFPALPTSGADTPVDAFVADGAVRATDSTDDENNGYNRPDEVVLTLPTTDATQPPAGETAKPDLQSITRDQNVVTENYSVSFTFDQAICGVDLTNVAFDLYDENGVQFRVAGTAGGAGVTCSGNTVTFSIDDGFGGFSNEQIAAAVTGGVEDIDDAPELSADITVTEAQTGITEG